MQKTTDALSSAISKEALELSQTPLIAKKTKKMSNEKEHIVTRYAGTQTLQSHHFPNHLAQRIQIAPILEHRNQSTERKRQLEVGATDCDAPEQRCRTSLCKEKLPTTVNNLNEKAKTKKPKSPRPNSTQRVL